MPNFDDEASRIVYFHNQCRYLCSDIHSVFTNESNMYVIHIHNIVNKNSHARSISRVTAKSVTGNIVLFTVAQRLPLMS